MSTNELAQIVPIPFLLLFLLCIVNAVAHWEFPLAGNVQRRERTARAQRLITLGRYSERDGDRDMLQGDQQNNGRPGTIVDSSSPSSSSSAASSSIWGFSPNFDGGTSMRAQRDWSGQPMFDGPRPSPLFDQWQQQRQQPMASPSSPSSSANYNAAPHPRPLPPDQIARPLPSARVPIAIPSVPAFGGGTRAAIDRFETNLDRFATAPPPGSMPNRIVLPPNFFDQLKSGISAESAKAPAKFVGPRIDDLGGGGGGIGEGERTKLPEQPKTRILVNERIPAPDGNQFGRPPPAGPPPIVPVNGQPYFAYVPVNNGGGGGQQSSALGRPIDQGPPALWPHLRHEDIRPEGDGERLGPQWKFGGATNQYREDWGKEGTRSEQRPTIPIGEYGPKRVTTGDGPASKLIGSSGISAPREGTQLLIGANEPTGTAAVGGPQNTPLGGNVQQAGGGGRIVPYLNAPEELTGSRWRNVDEHFNGLNGGNRGRGPNRYVKVDLLNE